MSSANYWNGITQELTAGGIPFWPCSEGGEPWLSYAAIAMLTGVTAVTVERWCSGAQRHPFLPMVKASVFEAHKKKRDAQRLKRSAAKKARKRVAK